MQELGLTVAVFDEKALKELQGDDLFAIGDQLPNVQIYTSANLASFTIRGIWCDYAGRRIHARERNTI